MKSFLTIDSYLNSDNPEFMKSPEEIIKALFNFDYCMPDEYKPIFEYKFFLRYRFNPINYDSFRMFQNFLESKLAEIMPRYNQLYNSEGLILNPFVNTAIREDGFTSSRLRAKDYNTANGNNFTHNTNRNGSFNYGLGTSDNSGNSSSESSSESQDKSKGTSDTKKRDINLFSDTPQSSQTKEEVFNDGYTTTKNLDVKRDAAITSDLKEGYQKGGSISSDTRNSTNKSLSEAVGEGEGTGYGIHYTDGYSVAARAQSLKNAVERTGLSGITVSAIINEWRTTFINIDKMLLDEMEDLFLRVY